MALNSIATIF